MENETPRHELVYRQPAPTPGATWPFHLLIAANSLALFAGAAVRDDAMALLGLLIATAMANSGSALLMIRGRSRQERHEAIRVLNRQLDERCHLDRIPGHLRRLRLGGATMVVAPRNAPMVGSRARLMFAVEGSEYILPVEVMDATRRSGSTTVELAFDPSDLELVAGVLPLLTTARRRPARRRGRTPQDRAA